eukprot:m.98312 g.98312  ORF g.98312 m.98312 type:complete len:85 (-) comp14866_c0_seq1:124-378(-)
MELLKEILWEEGQQRVLCCADAVVDIALLMGCCTVVRPDYTLLIMLPLVLGHACFSCLWLDKGSKRAGRSIHKPRRLNGRLYEG